MPEYNTFTTPGALAGGIGDLFVNTKSNGQAGLFDGVWNAFTGNKDWERQQILAGQQMNFNAMEAQKNRDWQERMSNTAYQRQVADMKAAGINPYAALSHGASVGGGATASASQAGAGSSGSGFGALLSFVGKIATSAIFAASRSTVAQTAAFNALERQTERIDAEQGFREYMIQKYGGWNRRY